MELSGVREGDWRFEEVEGGIGVIDGEEGGFKRTVHYHATGLGQEIRIRQNALIGDYLVVLNEEPRLFTACLRETDIIRILEIVGKVLLTIRIDEWIEKVDRKEEISIVIVEELINLSLGGARTSIDMIDRAFPSDDIQGL